jgi:serine/threonine protein kinase
VASTRLGRYDILKTLARGALSNLLLGRASGMEGFQRYVAIKQLRAESARDASCVESFVSEARLSAVLHHHNIVQVHDIGEEAGQPYFAMEYVHGVDLRTLLTQLAKRNEQLPLQHVVSIVASAAAALHHAHEQRGGDGQPLNIVHRDVTPGNILVGFDGNVKVVDFGIAKAAIKRIQSDAGAIKGRAPYMSPEQCAGKAIDRRSDVFALGIVLYELATVRRLFKGASDFLTMSAVCNAEVPKPSQYRRDIPTQLEAIMLKALARDPRERFQSAGEMSVALDEIASTVGVGASTTALASYMRLQFGDQKEPWLLPGKPAPLRDFEGETTDVDFDGGASGLAPPPTESLQKMAMPRAIAASKDSPLAAARTHAITPPAAEKARLPLPSPSLRASTRPPPVVDDAIELEMADLGDADNETPTERGPNFARASAAHEVVSAGDSTALVEPLPITSPEYVVPRQRPRAHWIALFSMVVGAAAVAVVVYWPGADVRPTVAVAAEPVPAPPAEPPPTPAVDVAPAPAADVTPAPEPAAGANPTTKSALEMTQADYERERARHAEAAAAIESTPAPVVEKAPEPVVERAPEPAVERAPEPAAKKTPTSPKRPTAKAPPPRAAAKPATKPAAKKPAVKKPAAKKPTWNPDDLFLDEK